MNNNGIIFLYGAPASGKSTLGRRLAERLDARFSDLDDEIVSRAGRPIPEIFASDGEPAFRDLESKALAEVCGGGRSMDADRIAPNNTDKEWEF